MIAKAAPFRNRFAAATAASQPIVAVAWLGFFAGSKSGQMRFGIRWCIGVLRGIPAWYGRAGSCMQKIYDNVPGARPLCRGSDVGIQSRLDTETIWKETSP